MKALSAIIAAAVTMVVGFMASSFVWLSMDGVNVRGFGAFLPAHLLAMLVLAGLAGYVATRLPSVWQRRSPPVFSMATLLASVSATVMLSFVAIAIVSALTLVGFSLYNT